MAEDEMVGWHHQLDGHEFEYAPGIEDRQGSLVCCSLWGLKESDTAERLNLLTSKGKRVLSCRSSQPNRHMIFEAPQSLL